LGRKEDFTSKDHFLEIFRNDCETENKNVNIMLKLNMLRTIIVDRYSEKKVKIAVFTFL